MKKISLISVACFGLLTLGFQGCKDDPASSLPSAITSEELAGTWNITQMDIDGTVDFTIKFGEFESDTSITLDTTITYNDAEQSITFNQDGSFSARVISPNSLNSIGSQNSTSIETITGTYQLDATNISFTTDSDDDILSGTEPATIVKTASGFRITSPIKVQDPLITMDLDITIFGEK